MATTKVPTIGTVISACEQFTRNGGFLRSDYGADFAALQRIILQYADDVRAKEAESEVLLQADKNGDVTAYAQDGKQLAVWGVELSSRPRKGCKTVSINCVTRPARWV